MRHLKFAVLLLSTTWQGAASAQRHTYVVDSVGDVGQWTSIAYDSQTRPHILYFEELVPAGSVDPPTFPAFDIGRMKHAFWDGTGIWRIETVDEGVGCPDADCGGTQNNAARGALAMENDHAHAVFVTYTTQIFGWESTTSVRYRQRGTNGAWSTPELIAEEFTEEAPSDRPRLERVVLSTM